MPPRPRRMKGIGVKEPCRNLDTLPAIAFHEFRASTGEFRSRIGVSQNGGTPLQTPTCDHLYYGDLQTVPLIWETLSLMNPRISHQICPIYPFKGTSNLGKSPPIEAVSQSNGCIVNIPRFGVPSSIGSFSQNPACVATGRCTSPKFPVYSYSP